jgi:hypothetical protein
LYKYLPTYKLGKEGKIIRVLEKNTIVCAKKGNEIFELLMRKMTGKLFTLSLLFRLLTWDQKMSNSGHLK